MLESNLRTDNAFLTLTYSDENLPRLDSSSGTMSNTTALPTLNPKHLQDWLKRFRKAIEPSRIRYYAVGEYGDETERPHYHVAVFGYPSCLRGGTKRKYALSGPLQWSICCPTCRLVGETWGLGDVHLGNLVTESAQYLAGYVTKKMTSKYDDRLYGRHPEFARMSLRPGIGADFVHEVASSLLEFNLEESQADVPSALRHGSRLMPLGRYLRSRLRSTVGKSPNAPESTLQEIEAELYPLRIAAKTDPSATTLKQQIIKAADQQVRNIEAKQRIHRKVRTI